MKPGKPSRLPERNLQGREREVRQVIDTIVDLSASRTLTVIEGEPGIGKSHLLGQIRTVATGLGFMVLHADPHEDDRLIPYATFLELFGDTIRLTGDRTLVALINAWCACGALAAQRHPLRDAVDSLLRVAGVTAGVVLLIDDAHRMDVFSARLLRHLLHRPPSVPFHAVLTDRAWRTGDDLLLTASTHRMLLGPLSATEVDRQLDGQPADRRDQIVRLALGNPRYLRALVALPTSKLTELADDAPGDQPPAEVTETFAPELEHLDQAELLILQSAAVLGSELDLATVIHIAQVDRRTATEKLDSLVRRDLVRVTAGRLQLRHPLLRLAVYWSAGPVWLAEAHARAATYLKDRSAAPDRCAEHVAHAMQFGDVAAVGILLTAARSTTDTAPVASVRWLRSALRALPDRPHLDESRAELQLFYAKALTRCGRLDEAREALSGLAEKPHSFQFAVIRQLAIVERLTGRHGAARAMLSPWLGRARSVDPLQHALRLELAANELLDGHFSGAARHALIAQRQAELAGDRQGMASAATVLAGSVAATGSFSEARSAIVRASALADSLTDDQVRDQLEMMALLSWLEHRIDLRVDALRHVERSLDLARRHGRQHAMPQLLTVRADIHATVGRLAESLRDVEVAHDMASGHHCEDNATLALAVGLRPTLWCAGPGPVEATLASMRNAGLPHSAWYAEIIRLRIGEAYLAVGDEDAAQELLTDALPPSTRGPGSAELRLLHAVADLGSPAAPALLSEAREALGDAESGLGQVATADARRVLAAGLTGEAISLAQTAVAQLAHARTPVREAQARMVLAEAYIAAGDTAAAREQLGAAKRIFLVCGAIWMALAAGRAEHSIGARLSRTKADDGLSARERQVADLVADGLTNQQIASRLILSRRTVESHVVRIVAKLHLPSRAAIGRHLVMVRQDR